MSLADGENEEGTGYGRDGNLNHLVFVDYRGMILTMFIPHIFPDAPNSRRQYDRVAPVQSRDERQEHRALVGEMGEAA